MQEQNWQCPECGVTLKVEKSKPHFHQCGEMYCSNCDGYHMEENHKCYMREITPNDVSDKFIFYDFECHQNNEGSEHIPNFVVAQSVCKECEEEDVTYSSKCNNCGSRCNICDKYDKKNT